MRTVLLWLRIAGLLLAVGSGGCSKKELPPPETPAAVDRIIVSKSNPPKNFLHKTFPVKHYEKFEFVVPAHSSTPRLQGSFQSFIKSESGDLLSNDAANVDLLVLNEQEFNDFSHGRQGTASYSADASHSQRVDYALASTLEAPATYYLVFRNPASGSGIKFVQADFTARFE